MRPRTRLRPALATAWLLAVLAGGPAPAQTYTWSGLGANNSWSTAANWQGGVVPVSGTGTAIVLTGTASPNPPNNIITTMNLGVFSLNSLTFASGAGPFVVSPSSNADYFNFPTIANGPICHIDQFSAAAQKLAFPNTGLQLNPFLFLGGNGTGPLTIDGTIAAVGGSGGGLILNGPYTVTLNGATTGTASSITLDAGTLRVNSDLAFGTSSVSFGGGTLQLINNLAVNHSMVLSAGGGTLDANGFAGAMANSGLTVTGPGRLTLTNTSNSGSLTINSQLQHTGGLTVTGANNTVTLGGNNSYTGGTTLSGGATLAIDTDGRLGNTSGGITFDGGTLRLSETASFNINRNVTLGAGGGTISIDSTAQPVGIQAISGIGWLTKTGTGRIGLLGANTYTGPTTVTGGYLDIVNNQAVQSTTVTLNGGTLGFYSQATAPVLGGLAGVTNLALGANSVSVGNTNASTTYA
ncbi:MAG TPA: autotransporter-associated beta strand repeat-containing protein, partial [Gemmataceae bacterium]|nr:autotransporter-associated beta strand repeat-containing protein [Gemmataceae bacterium]